MNAPVVLIDGYENVPAKDENALMKAVANQPVSIGMDAGGSDLQFYSEVIANYMHVCVYIHLTIYSYYRIQTGLNIFFREYSVGTVARN